LCSVFYLFIKQNLQLMSTKVLLTIAALIGAICGGLWYHNTYMCCCNTNKTNTNNGATKTANSLPYYFTAANDKTIDLSASFGKYGDSLQRNYGAGDTLKIVGYYYNTEDSTVAMERANQVNQCYLCN
jgi:hypothetical protein